ncbi:MAG: FAD-dependent oxidoreductase [Candidatus Pacearchaeota archaeon]|jgi:NADH dehydrogenase FAD-containing subunit
MKTKKRVVIVGGGFAGSYIAKNLENSFNVTLIDNKDFFEFTPSILRTLVEPSHILKIILYHKLYLKKTYVINGNVTSFDKTHVIINKLKIPYDYLVIASGSKYIAPIKDENIIMTSRSKDIRDSYNKLKKSKNILIVGGGLVGVELASEIATKFKDKEIGLIDSNDRLISRNPLKASKYVEKFLKKHKVKLILGEKLIEFKKGSYLTDKNKKINADLVYICTGIIPNSEFIQKTNKYYLDEKNFLIVNEFLQINNKNIFGAGDIINIKEEKTAQNAEEHAKIIVKNIIRIEKNKSLKKYKSKPRIIALSLGKYNGLLIYKNFFIKGLIPAIIKSYIEKSFMRK